MAVGERDDSGGRGGWTQPKLMLRALYAVATVQQRKRSWATCWTRESMYENDPNSDC